jgi:hypothetical protein
MTCKGGDAAVFGQEIASVAYLAQIKFLWRHFHTINLLVSRYKGSDFPGR